MSAKKQAPKDPKPESKEELYKRVYEELGGEFLETAKKLREWLDSGNTRQVVSRAQQEHVLTTRLVSTAIGYFSRQLSGVDTPNSSWVEAIALVLRHPEAIDPMPLMCRHHRICPFYKNLLVDPRAESEPS